MKKLTLRDILSPTVVTVGTEVVIPEVLAMMASLNISCIVAVNGKKQPVGIFTEQDALRLLGDNQPRDKLVLANVMTAHPLCASPDMDFRDAFNLLQTHGFRHLIVTDEDGQLLGIVTEGDFLHSLGLQELTEFKTVAKVMSQSFSTTEVTESIVNAARRMHDRRHSCIIALQDGTPVGIISERDAVRLNLDISDPKTAIVGKVMKSPLISVTPDTTLPDAISLMQAHKIRNLAVIEQGKLVGLVNRHSLTKTLQGDYIEFLRDTIEKQRDRIWQLDHQHILNKLHGAALEASANAILITDAEGVIQWTNDAFSKLSGYDANEAVGRQPKELVKSGLQSREFYAALWQSILDGKVWHGEIVNKHKDGSLYTEEITITPVRTANNHITHFVAVMQNISTRKLHEKMQSASNNVLDRIIANQPLSEILLATIHHLENIFPEMRASVLLLNEETGLLEQGFAPNLPEVYTTAIRESHPIPEVCWCGTPAHSGQTATIEDVATHPYCDPFQELADQTGLRACGAIPFTNSAGTVLGVLNIFFAKPYQPSPAEFGFLSEFARLAGIAAAKEKSETQRHVISDSLHKSEENYRNLVEAAPFPVVISRLTNGELLYGNRRAELMFGIIQNEGIGKPASNFYVNSADRDRFISAIQEHAIVTDFETRLYKADGAIICVLLSGRIMEFDGQPALATSFVDITERKDYEGRLREAAAVMESTQEGVMITDLTPSIIAVNRACATITGYSEAEMLGKNPNIFKSGRENALFFENMWTQLLKHGHWHGEIWNRRKNGEIFPQLLTINTIYNENREPIRYVGVFTDISDLKENQTQLDFLAHHDPLTRLPNRSMVESRLEQEIEQSHRHNQKFAVLFIDLDRFKIVNDSFGHPVGDELLCQVAERLGARLREGDTLARLGGDEFLLLATTLNDSQDAAILARDVITALGESFLLAGNYEVFIGGSVGISLFPNDGITATELMKNADAAMYLAKENGRNQFSFYTSELNADAHNKLALENELRRALLRNDLQLHYQAKIDLHSGKICGLEALIRWQKPDGSMMPPAEFIPLAEKTGIILAIGNLVLERACQQIRQWLDQGMELVQIAINISARQFRNGNLDKLVEQQLLKHRIAGHHLELELNENMLMYDPEQAIETMHKLKNLGVKLSLDDFGTGYSNLAYLRRFPIDSLKIDKSFVRGMIADPSDAEVASVIINLAHSLKLSVIAEGVENEAQLAFMRKNNCDELQGYLFSQVLPAAEFTELLRSGKPLA
ncbi:MAG: EAL domain-containing protein [Gallionella sp.]|nr:EAL domain-containing protein [Gallionella sp.]MDD5611776.1 EAL domain-containing protein [Gallionella sp.]